MKEKEDKATHHHLFKKNLKCWFSNIWILYTKIHFAWKMEVGPGVKNLSWKYAGLTWKTLSWQVDRQFLDAFLHIYKRVCPSVRPSHELKPCKSAVFDHNYYQHEREHNLCRVSSLVSLMSQRTMRNVICVDLRRKNHILARHVLERNRRDGSALASQIQSIRAPTAACWGEGWRG